MNPDKQFSWTLAQSGKVSVTHHQLIRGTMSKVLIQCDCLSDSLLSEIARGDSQSDRSSEPTWLDSQLKKKKAAAAAAKADKDDGGGVREGGAKGEADKDKKAKNKTLVMRVKTAELKGNDLLLTNGELTLQGEDVIVRDGVSYFQGKSQLASAPHSGPPVLSGSQVDKKRLKALASKDGLSNLYFGNSELLDGQRALIQNPQIQFGNQVYPMESVARRRSSAEEIDKELLRKILPNFEQLSAMAEEGSGQAARTADGQDDGGLNKVVLVNGRCVIKDDCIVILRGLLHVGCAWHRVISSLLVGSKPSGSPRPVTITGTPVYKDAAACAQLLLSNVTLYSRGSTVYAGNTPLLKDAVLHADGQVLNIADLHLSSICGMDPPEEPEPARLFVQGGKFTVDESTLNIMEGTVWFREAKVQLPDDSTEEVRVKDALIFLTPDSSPDGASKMGASLHDGRDIIYKDNLLFLDDLTPLLKGGFICHEDKQQPLAWLSSDANAMRRAQQSQLLRPSVLDPPGDRERMLTSGTCIVDSNGMYFIEGCMILHDKQVMIDKGVPLFSSDFNEEDRKTRLGALPPRLTGRVLMDSKTAREVGGKSLKGFIILRNVQLDMTDGQITVNSKVPVLTDCKFILDKQVLSPAVLGVEPKPREAPSKHDSKESGVLSDHTESAKPQVAAKSPKRRVASNDRAVKADPPSDGQRASDLDESGRGASDAGADRGQRTTSEPDTSQKTSGAAVDAHPKKANGGGPGSGAEGASEAASPSVTDGTSGAHEPRQRDKPASQGARDGGSLARDQAPADTDGQLKRDGSVGASRPGRPSAGGAEGERIRVDLGGPELDVTRGGGGAAAAPSKKDGSEATAEAPGGRDDPAGTSRLGAKVPDRADGAAGGELKTMSDTQLGGGSLASRTTAFGETSSAGVLGKFSVSTSDAKQVVFSLRARIEDTLHFLDLNV